MSEFYSEYIKKMNRIGKITGCLGVLASLIGGTIWSCI